MIILATTSLIPFECYEIWRRSSLLRVAALLFNVGIVAYLIENRRSLGGERLSASRPALGRGHRGARVMMAITAMASVLLIFLVLMDAFETMLLPRRVKRPFRFARAFYVYSWTPWAAAARMFLPQKRRDTFLSLFGPLSILVLLGLWAFGLIMGFGLLHWALGTPLGSHGEAARLGVYAYFCGVTFFTLGYGDVTPVEPLGRILAVVETGIGFGFLAVVISYLPVLYQAFSRREVTISLLDARAGSPPTAGTLLGRRCTCGNVDLLGQFLAEWERWAAEVLESHISFPVLSFYRSQHDNQSWLAALTAILDTSALVVSGVQEGRPVPGLADLRDGPARGRGPGPGLPGPARRADGRSASRRSPGRPQGLPRHGGARSSATARTSSAG